MSDAMTVLQIWETWNRWKQPVGLKGEAGIRTTSDFAKSMGKTEKLLKKLRNRHCPDPWGEGNTEGVDHLTDN